MNITVDLENINEKVSKVVTNMAAKMKSLATRKQPSNVQGCMEYLMSEIEQAANQGEFSYRLGEYIHCRHRFSDVGGFNHIWKLLEKEGFTVDDSNGVFYVEWD